MSNPRCPRCEHPHTEYQRITGPERYGATSFMVYHCPACCYITVANSVQISPRLQHWLNRENERSLYLAHLAHIRQALTALHRMQQQTVRAIGTLADRYAQSKQWDTGHLLHGDGDD